MNQYWTTLMKGDVRCPLTRLSLLLNARATDAKAGKEARDVFWKAYWKPLFAFLRATGIDNETAKDRVQGFATKHEVHVVTGSANSIFDFEPGKGKFRNFLLECFRNYLHDERARETAEKRGGKRGPGISWDEHEEKSGGTEQSREPTPEEAFERAYALGRLARAWALLQEELKADGDDKWIPVVEMIEREAGDLPLTYAEIARNVGVGEGAVRSRISRFKKAVGELIWREILQETKNEEEAKEELGNFFKALEQRKRP